MAIDIPDHLIELERTAWAEIQEGRLTIEAAEAVQAAVTEYAAEKGLPRYEVEMAVKKAVRHPTPEV